MSLPTNAPAYIAGQMIAERRKAEMIKYRNEALFSRAVCAHLRKQGYFVQRIETGSTGRGVPDIYCITPDGRAMWLELKRVHSSAKGKDRVTIPWRPGQQAWLNMVHKFRQTARTLVAFDDCIMIVGHSHIWANDIILFSQCQKILSIQDL